MLDRNSIVRNELLLELSRRGAGSQLPPPAPSILRVKREREAFLEVATTHFLHGLVLSRLATLDPVDADHEAIARRSAATIRSLRAKASLWDLERDRILTLLALQDAQPVLLKGAALRCTAYRDPVHRPLGDIDLLVRPEEFDLTLEVLREIGYRAPYSAEEIEALRKYHFHLRVVRDPFIVEVHWDLAQESQPFQLDAAGFIRNARQIEVGPGHRQRPLKALVPAAEDMVSHLVSQNLHHGTRLGRLVDIDRISASGDGVDWEALRDRAIESGLRVALAVDLRLCQALLGTELPHGLVSGLGLSNRRLRNLAILRPESWPFSTAGTRPTVKDLRRRWCISDDFTRERRGKRHPLQWIWPDKPLDIVRPSLVDKWTRVSKLIAYQIWLYLRASASYLASAGRRGSRFWQEPARDQAS